MIKIKTMVGLLLASGTALLGQTATFSKEALRADAQTLERALREAHPAGRDSSTLIGWGSYRDSLLGRLPDEVYAGQANLFFRALAARLNCIHTYLVTPIAVDSILPMGVEALADGALVSRSQHPGIPVGSQVLAINGQSWEALLATFRPFVASDSPDPGFRNFVVARNLSLYLRHWMGWRGPLQLRLRRPNRNQPDTLRVNWIAPVKTSPTRAPRSRIDTLFRLPQGNFWVDTLFPQAAQLQLRGFSGKNYRQFYQRVQTYLTQHPLQHLIIDLRNNPGGNIFHAFHLIRWLSTTPFHYQLERRPFTAREHFNFGNQLLINLLQGRYTLPGPYRKGRAEELKTYTRRFQPAQSKGFAGKIWVLTNAYCASSGSLAASYLQQHAGAVVVGGTTGGGAWSNNGGSFPKLLLPQTRFKINFPLYRLNYQLGPVQTAGVMPDYPVTLRCRDWLARRDPAMEQVYELIRQDVGKKAP